MLYYQKFLGKDCQYNLSYNSSIFIFFIDFKIPKEEFLYKPIEFSILKNIFFCPTYVISLYVEWRKIKVWLKVKKKCIFLRFEKEIKSHKFWDLEIIKWWVKMCTIKGMYGKKD